MQPLEASRPSRLPYQGPSPEYYQPPHADMTYANRPRGGNNSWRQELLRFTTKQAVEVRIRTNCWALGIVVGTLQFFSKFAGWGYEIEYQDPSGGRFRNAFCSEDIRRPAQESFPPRDYQGF